MGFNSGFKGLMFITLLRACLLYIERTVMAVLETDILEFLCPVYSQYDT